MIQENHYEIHFSIAGHLVDVYLPSYFNVERYLPSFTSFRAENEATTLQQPILTLRCIHEIETQLKERQKLLYEGEISDADVRIYQYTGQSFLFEIFLEDDRRCYRMVADNQFKYIIGEYADTTESQAALINIYLMIAFAQAALLNNTILIHASAVTVSSAGFAFLGKSGTGKSTHSRLWLNTIDNAQLLNDDNPAIRVDDNGKVFIYGTPWSGKTPCYHNQKAQLKYIVRLEQHPGNVCIKTQSVDSFINLLPSYSFLRWNIDLHTALCNALEFIIDKVAVVRLLCIPNKEACLLCHENINN